MHHLADSMSKLNQGGQNNDAGGPGRAFQRTVYSSGEKEAVLMRTHNLSFKKNNVYLCKSLFYYRYNSGF